MNREVCVRTMRVPLDNDSNYGLGLSVGPTDQNLPRVIGIDSEGPADKSGYIRVGDRVLDINGISLDKFNVEECRKYIYNAGKGNSWLTIQYDVSVLSNIRSVGRIMVDVDDFRGTLGLTVTDSNDGVIISKIRLGSFAERCGAFQVGDKILAVKSSKRRLMNKFRAKDFANFIKNELSSFAIEILVPCCGAQHAQNSLGKSEIFEVGLNDFYWNPNSDSSHIPDVRIETQMVTLHLSTYEKYGIVYKQAHTDQGVVVCYIAPDSPAAKCGLLQIGDRIVMVNGRVPTKHTPKLEDVARTVHLQVQFDVQVWPVERKPLTAILLQRNFEPNFGLSFTCYNNEVVISDIRRGSVAYRCSQIQVGDQINKINGVKVTEKEIAQEIIQSSGSTLHLQLLPGELNCRDSGLSSLLSTSIHQSGIIYSSRADNREILDWGMESNSSSTDSCTSSQELNESSAASSIDYVSSLDLCKNKYYSDEATRSPKIKMAHLKINFLNPTSMNSRNMYIPLKGIPVPLNSSFCTFGWLEFQDELPEKEVKVILRRKSTSESFGFTVFYEDGRLFVKNIKPGSPASIQLMPYDEITFVDETRLCEVDGENFVKIITQIGRSLKLTLLRKETLEKVKRHSRWVDEIAVEAE